MILNYPSGFYRSSIPPSVNSRENITFTISNETPERALLFYLKIDLQLAQNSPPLVSVRPSRRPISGNIKAQRRNVFIDQASRPIGSVIEFSDRYRQLEVTPVELDQTVDFPRFNNENTIEQVNSKLLTSYRRFQTELVEVTRLSDSKQVELENLERKVNSRIAAVEAVEQALEFLVGDDDLIAAQNELSSDIDLFNSEIRALSGEIEVFDSRRRILQDSIRRLSKVLR